MNGVAWFSLGMLFVFTLFLGLISKNDMGWSYYTSLNRAQPPIGMGVLLVFMLGIMMGIGFFFSFPRNNHVYQKTYLGLTVLGTLAGTWWAFGMEVIFPGWEHERYLMAGFFYFPLAYFLGVRLIFWLASFLSKQVGEPPLR